MPPFYAHDWWTDIKEGKETYEIVKSIKKDVICPECGQEINVVYSRKLLENHVPEITKLERLAFWKENLKIKEE